MTRIGVLGTGLMGAPIAGRLLSAGSPVTVYNRTISKTTNLAAQGATVATDVAALFTATEVVVLMLTDAEAIAALLFANDVPLVGKTIIQMGTIAPQESQALHDQVAQRGGEYLEAPVLGSIPEAQSGNLIIMVGASEPQFQRWRPLLQTLGPAPCYIGPVGQAAAVKLALNQLIASLTTAFGLSLALIQQAGVDSAAFMEILRSSALYAPTFDKKLSRMLEGNYRNPNFPVKHLLKDVNLFAQAAEAAQIPAGLMTPIAALLEQTMAADLGDADYSALFSQITPQSP
jgi:3-hydroxyisobutyrate dehydrogenase